jgi:hypothetical protein
MNATCVLYVLQYCFAWLLACRMSFSPILCKRDESSRKHILRPEFQPLIRLSHSLMTESTNYVFVSSIRDTMSGQFCNIVDWRAWKHHCICLPRFNSFAEATPLFTGEPASAEKISSSVGVINVVRLRLIFSGEGWRIRRFEWGMLTDLPGENAMNIRVPILKCTIGQAQSWHLICKIERWSRIR